MLKMKMSGKTAGPIRRNRNGAFDKPTGDRGEWSRDLKPRSFRISRELVADRLRCMLEHIHRGRTRQVLLHSIAVASALTPVSPSVEAIRDFVEQAQGLFLRGDIRLAEERLHEALRYLRTKRTKGSRRSINPMFV